MSSSIKLEEITINGMTFQCRTCGLENKGDLIIFLHGFPESSYMWREALPIMAEKGYRCIAPDQRGYSKKARPIGEENYSIKYLAGDVVAFADYLGEEKFHLVGHDWGSGVAWATLAGYPARILSSTNISTYYPAEFVDLMKNNMKQREMSQYIFNFLRADEAERLAQNNSAGIKAYWSQLPQDSIDEYMKIFGDVEGITAALNWYRARYRWLENPNVQPDIPFEFGDVYVPVQCIRGFDDAYQGPDGFNRAHKYFKGNYTFTQLEGAGHWLLENNADQVIPRVADHVMRFTAKQ